jgi:apolipoprotein N-acyltransferase
MLQGIRLAHPALYGGWIALSWYLAFYLPAFIALSRVAVHRLGLPLVLAAPVVWVGLELLRGHLITGFSLGLLAHTQVQWTTLLQIADLGGAYAVSFVMITVAAAMARVAPLQRAGDPTLPRTLNPALVAIVLLAAALGYGAWRMNQSPNALDAHSIRIALIQGSRDTEFGNDPNYFRDTLEHYQRLTDQARRENERLDLVVWPESMFVVPEIQIKEPLEPPEGIPADSFRRRLQPAQEDFAAILAAESARANTLPNGSRQATPTLLLIGTNTYVYGPGDSDDSYNSALLADPDGQIIDRYYKQHAVMFGEYIPFGDLMPWLYSLTPMTGGLSVGSGPQPFQVAGLTLSPSICFESVVPHLIRGQATTLARRGQPADVLVNVTNDGWFWGSSILDLHFRCSIFRAIENRKPMVVGANTGISTWIDGNGVIRARGPKRATAILIADVRPDGRTSLYHVLGDLPGWLCAIACLLLAGVGFWQRKS